MTTHSVPSESNAIIIAETLCEGPPICESCILPHGGENTDPQSMDYPKMEYTTEVQILGLGN